jgi:hypothetical protein
MTVMIVLVDLHVLVVVVMIDLIKHQSKYHVALFLVLLRKLHVEPNGGLNKRRSRK